MLEIRTGNGLFRQKQTHSPKEYSAPKESDHNKAKSLYIGWHHIFGDGVVEGINGGAAQGSQYGEESLIHELPHAWLLPFFWHCPNKICCSSAIWVV